MQVKKVSSSKPSLPFLVVGKGPPFRQATVHTWLSLHGPYGDSDSRRSEVKQTLVVISYRFKENAQTHSIGRVFRSHFLRVAEKCFNVQKKGGGLIWEGFCTCRKGGVGCLHLQKRSGWTVAWGPSVPWGPWRLNQVWNCHIREGAAILGRGAAILGRGTAILGSHRAMTFAAFHFCGSHNPV